MTENTSEIGLESFQRDAVDALEAPKGVTFLTGKAGSGKTTLIRAWRHAHPDRMILTLAPTGIAALQADGETIHRFMHARPDITPTAAYRKGREAASDPTQAGWDAIIVDEISMVRADLLDCLDQYLQGMLGRRIPFGGMRIILVGDLAQLPPVIADEEKDAFLEFWEGPWFFQSQVMKRLLTGASGSRFTPVSLDKVWRQTDQTFVDALNRIREGTADRNILATVNLRAGHAPEPDAIVLCSSNRRADAINDARLNRLNGPDRHWTAKRDGEWDRRLEPAPAHIRTRDGMRVMMLRNDPGGQWANGSMGVILHHLEGGVQVRLDPDRTGYSPIVDVYPTEWEVTRRTIITDPETKRKRLETETVGSYRQLPLRAGWAVTIHKSQGRTFDRVHVELPKGALRTPGQAYVALSRCRSLRGLTMSRPLTVWDARADENALRFTNTMHPVDGAEQETLF